MQVSTTISKWYSLLGVGLTLCVVGLLVSAGCQAPPPSPGPACEADADCDDGLFCNGPETCVDGDCQAGEAPCTATTVECSEEANECLRVCLEDVGCDDDNECTDDACVDGVCQNTDNTAVCDDGDACTENDVCTNGECTPGKTGKKRA